MMRYRVLTWLACGPLWRLWPDVPESWRYWWASEWVRRHLRERSGE